MAKEKAVRLLDVARRAGVGVGTASRVLNNESSVSEERRRRVLKAIEELDYRPNAIARSLKVSRTKTLGVIIPDVSNEFYSEIVRGTVEGNTITSSCAVPTADRKKRDTRWLCSAKSWWTVSSCCPMISAGSF